MNKHSDTEWNGAKQKTHRCCVSFNLTYTSVVTVLYQWREKKHSINFRRHDNWGALHVTGDWIKMGSLFKVNDISYTFMNDSLKRFTILLCVSKNRRVKNSAEFKIKSFNSKFKFIKRMEIHRSDWIFFFVWYQEFEHSNHTKSFVLSLFSIYRWREKATHLSITRICNNVNEIRRKSRCEMFRCEMFRCSEAM